MTAVLEFAVSQIGEFMGTLDTVTFSVGGQQVSMFQVFIVSPFIMWAVEKTIRRLFDDSRGES